jgi:hypothetical protein
MIRENAVLPEDVEKKAQQKRNVRLQQVGSGPTQIMQAPWNDGMVAKV